MTALIVTRIWIELAVWAAMVSTAQFSLSGSRLMPSPGITDLGITESGNTESGVTWEIGIRYNRTWYNRISYNIKVECGITESSITETSITWKFESGIWYNTKKESAITESGITESGITRKRNLA